MGYQATLAELQMKSQAADNDARSSGTKALGSVLAEGPALKPLVCRASTWHTAGKLMHYNQLSKAAGVRTLAATYTGMTQHMLAEDCCTVEWSLTTLFAQAHKVECSSCPGKDKQLGRQVAVLTQHLSDKPY